MCREDAAEPREGLPWQGLPSSGWGLAGTEGFEEAVEAPPRKALPGRELPGDMLRTSGTEEGRRWFVESASASSVAERGHWSAISGKG